MQVARAKPAFLLPSTHGSGFLLAHRTIRTSRREPGTGVKMPDRLFCSPRLVGPGRCRTRPTHATTPRPSEGDAQRNDIAGDAMSDISAASAARSSLLTSDQCHGFPGRPREPANRPTPPAMPRVARAMRSSSSVSAGKRSGTVFRLPCAMSHVCVRTTRPKERPPPAHTRSSA